MVNGISFGGLMSGIDTDSLIKALVDQRRYTVTNLENQAVELSFYKSILRRINTNILNLQKTALNMRLESTFKTKKVSVSDPNLVSVTAGINALQRSYLLEVNKLARAATAVSGLGSRAYLRGAGALIQNNTAGIHAAEMTTTNLAGVRATMNSLITETLQAGKGDGEVTAGDKITITGTRKDGSAVNATFTFNRDNTDTVQRLANAIKSAFGGDVDVVLDTNGAFVLFEKDTSVSGDFTLTGLSFVDADYSGSTLSIGIGNSLASGGAQAQVITGTRTFTTGNSAVIADATTLLDSSLDQITGGNLDDGEDKIHITGKDHDGNSIDAYYTYTAGDTFQAVLDAIGTAYGSTVTATMENGKIVVTDNTTGASQLSMSLAFEDAGANTNTFQLGVMITSKTGATETAQIIKTSKFEIPAIGKYFLNYSDGKGGQVTGTVSLDADTLLGDTSKFPGLTNLNLFTIDRDSGTGESSPVTVLGLNERSSVQDLIEAINAQVPDVTARLVPDGSGHSYLQITANRGGDNFRITDAAGGILENILNPSGGADTDWTTANATTDATDFTVIAEFTPNAGNGVLRTIVAGDEGSAITNLIDNFSIEGTGANSFSSGVALIYTNESSELNIQPATNSHIIGASGISSSSTTPRLNVLATLAEAGFATTPKNASDSPDFHTDGFFTINGKRITINDVDNMTVNELLGEINTSGAGVVASYDASVDRIILRATQSGGAQSITLGGGGDTSNFLTIAGLTENAGGVFQAGNDAGKINPDKLIAYAGFTFLPGSGTFTINGVTISINQATDTLKTVINKINNSGAGVIAVYDENTDRLTLAQDLSKETPFDRISVGNASDTSAFLASVRLTDTPSITTEVGSQRQKAEFMIDGTSYVRNNNRINDVIADVTLELKSETTTPIGIGIAVDTDRAIRAVADFVVQYNTIMQIVNPQPLSKDEREQMVSLTTNDYNTMSLTEIDDYETNRQTYRERNTIFNDSTTRRLNSLMRQFLFDNVSGLADGLNSLSAVGITTGLVNSGMDESETPYLVDDTTDVDAIVAKLSENHDLVDTIAENPDAIFNLFGNPLLSKIEVAGSMNLLTGISVIKGLSFHVGTGGRTATVTFRPGNYTFNDVMNQIRESLANANLARDITMTLDSSNHIVFSNQTQDGKAEVYLYDLGAGDRLDNLLGLESGTFRGADAQASAGIAIRLDHFLKSYTGVNGIIQSRITTGGEIDDQIGYLKDQIDAYEDRLTQYEERLRNQFTAMEMALAKFQQTSQFVSAYLSNTQNANNNSYNNQ